MTEGRNDIKIGAEAPDFTLMAHDGMPVTLSSFRNQKVVILYFYPRDETAVCVAQACYFRDNYRQFRDLDAEVLGISTDSVESHQSFIANYRLPFTLLSDRTSKVRKLFGVKSTFGIFPGRVTYVIDQQGIIRHIFSAQFRPFKHVEQALQTARTLVKTGGQTPILDGLDGDDADRDARMRTLLSYVPQDMILRLHSANNDPLQPAQAEFDAAVLFADVAGFTKLAEQLAAQGPAGAERLTRLLNSYFGTMNELIRSHGGESVKFAGDAILALWSRDDATLAERCHQALQCADSIQRGFAERRVDGHQLQLRIGLSCGPVQSYHVGGGLGRWEFVCAGDPLELVARAEHAAEPGEVICHSTLWDHVSKVARGVEAAPGLQRLGTLDPLPRLPDPPPQHLGEDDLPRLWSYIPGAIRARLTSDLKGWLGELRRVSVLFVNLKDLDTSSNDLGLDQLQAAMYAIQSVLYTHEGSLNKLLVDDKGKVLIGGFGLPPLAHEDDPVRAIQAAMDIQQKLHALDMSCSIGITTGRVFCGPVGCDVRREYTIIGDIVNVSARLMQAAGDDILCDEETFDCASNDFTFETLPAIKAKGKQIRLRVFSPVSRIAAGEVRGSLIVGRPKQRQEAIDQLRALKESCSGLLLIEGEPGMGKSQLVSELRRQAESYNLTPLCGRGDAIDRDQPYHAWRGIFIQIFGLEGSDELELRRHCVLSKLTHDTELSQLAPLLNSVLPIELPDNETTSRLLGEGRANTTRDLLIRLLQSASETEPLLITIENAHWLDSSSWELLLLARRYVEPLLLVVSLRPFEEAQPRAFEALGQDPDSRRLRLLALTLEETRSFLAERLGVDSLPEELGALIHERAGGNPFFSQELLYSLRDQKLFAVEEAGCVLSDSFAKQGTLNLPETLKSSITSRLDRLDPKQQLTLKAASVVGRVFKVEAVAAIHPTKPPPSQVLEQLSELRELGIVSPLGKNDVGSFAFTNDVFQRAIYELLLYEQRARLHEALARAYEAPGSVDSSHASLAYHWELAGHPEQAISHLERAGEEALRDFSASEAVSFFERALELSTQCWGASPTRDQSRRRGAWRRGLGDSWQELGRPDRCREQLESALADLGWPISRSGLGLAAKIARELGRQTLNRLLRTFTKGRRRPAKAEASPAARALLEAVRADIGLIEAYYIDQEKELALYVTLQALNLAERLPGASRELAQAYGNAAVVAGLIPLPKLIKLYARAALEVAEDLGDDQARAFIKSRTSVAFAAQGDWETTHRFLDEAVVIDRKLGNLRLAGTSLALKATTSALQGLYKEANQLSGENLILAQRRKDTQHLAWNTAIKAEALFRLGDLEAAQRFLDECATHIEARPENGTAIMLHGIQALIHLRQGRVELSRTCLNTALELIEATPPTVFFALEGYSAATEVALELWQRAGPGSGSSRDERQLAKRACSELRRYAKVIAMARPRCALWTGRWHWLRGRRSRARSHWARGLRLADSYKLPCDRALILLEQSHAVGRSSESIPWLREAKALLEAAGAKLDLRRLESIGPAPAGG